MSDTRDARHVLDEAAAAASAGDYATAEERLREAAALQESELGPGHQDLANTLNNLGVVYDILGKADHAELCYRRALAIAVATLDAEHEFVVTSRRNLQDFYRTHGRLADAAEIEHAAGTRQAPRVRVAARRTRKGHTAAAGGDAGWSWRSTRAWTAAAAVAAIIAAGWLSVRLVWPTESRELTSHAEQALGALPGAPASTLAADHSLAPLDVNRPPAPGERRTTDLALPSPPATDARSPAPTRGAAEPAASQGARDAPPSAHANSAARAVPGPELSAAEADLCTELDTGGGAGRWHCEAAGVTPGQGMLYFYTRVRSTGTTTVRHLWYHDDALKRSVDLRIGASPTEGYRTYSRLRMGPEDVGEWRVELRSVGGDLLHETRVTVQ